MATRDRARLRDRSKSSDISGEPSSGALPTWQPQNGPSRLAPGQGHALHAPVPSTLPPSMFSALGAAANLHTKSAADLLMQAAAAVNRADALQRNEASESDVSPRSRQNGLPRLVGGRPKRRREGKQERQMAKRERERALEAEAELTADEQQAQPDRRTHEAQPEDEGAGLSANETRRIRRKVFLPSFHAQQY